MSCSSLPMEGSAVQALFQGEAEAQQRQGSGWGSHRDGRQDFPQQREPEAAGSDSVGHRPQMEPSWASGAAAGDGRGCPRPPTVPWGRLRAQTLGTGRRACGCHPADKFPGCRIPPALGPGGTGAGWFRQRGCGCVSGLPPWPLSGPVSPSRSLRSSVWKLWKLLSPVSASLYFSYFLTLFSFCFHSPSLPPSVDPCPPASSPASPGQPLQQASWEPT